MYSKNKVTRQNWREFKRALPLLEAAKDIIGFGMGAKQWLACVMICMMLMPIFSLPVAGSVYSTSRTDTENFEPVNEELPVWTEAWRNLNARIESWTAARRPDSLPSDENEDEKKKKKKSADPAENKTAAATVEKTPDGAKPESQNDDRSTSEKSKSDKKESKSTPENAPEPEVRNKAAVTSVLMNQLPDSEKGSVYNYENNLGAPPGQVEKDSSNQAAALAIRHRAGIANFSFGLPLAGLAGRGLDAGIGLTYNSRTWNRSQTVDINNNVVDHFTYDVEQSWIAPGFSSGFGYLETEARVQYIHPYQSSNFQYYTEIVPVGITDTDGTRRQLVCSSWSPIYNSYSFRCDAYTSTDGTFLSISARPWVSNPGNGQSPNLNAYVGASFDFVFPGGRKISYSTGFGSGASRKHHPVKIRDRNGNYITIAYKNDQSGRIDYINDTLSRKIKFYYENDGSGNPDKLIAVTIPGMGANEEIQTARLYYEDLTLPTDGFASPAVVTAPATIRVLKYIFMPTTKTGYKYEYHPKFGMIKKITRQVGMSASTTATNTMGTLTEGIFAASTEYDYPSGSPAVSDVPKYTQRTDDWQGRTAATPQITLYNSPTPTPGSDILSQITVKDSGFDVMTENKSHNTNDWKSGLIKETSIIRVATGSFPNKLMSKTVYTWAQGSIAPGGRQNPILQKTEQTNEAGLTKKIEYEYDQYNNQTKIKEYDYGTTSPTLLRTTEIEYETGAGWIANQLLSLTKSVKTIVGGVTVAKTVYEYDHNGSDTALTTYTDIINHEGAFNPYNPPRVCERCCPDPNGEPNCNPQAAEEVTSEEEARGKEVEKGDKNNVVMDFCFTRCTGEYIDSTKYRGNVTKVTAFSDATLASDSNADVKNYEYDIAGSIVSATLSCCSLKTFAYDKANEYAFPISETKGSSPTQLTVSMTYNKNTGLVLTSTDENNQVTSYEYETDTLREKKTTYSTGGFVLTEYSDKLVANVNDLLPSFIRTTKTLDTNKTAESYSYFNGRGDGIRSATQTPDGWSVAAVEFDKVGRPYKAYNPFFVSTPTGAIPVNTKFTQVLTYDALNRATSSQLQDNTTVSTEFSDTTTTPSGFAKSFVTLTDQVGKKRRQVSDALGRVVRVDEPDASGNLTAVDAPNQATSTSYEYDGNDNLSKVTQSDGTVTQERLFKYDSLSRLTHEKQVEGTPTLNNAGVKVASGGLWTRVSKYDAEGLLTDDYDANGVNTHVTYDNMNRILSVTYSGETGYQTPAVNYTYDEVRAGFYNKGRLTKVTTAAVTGTQGTPATEQVYDFNKMGQVVKQQNKIDGQSYQLEYGYNLLGQLVSEKYPSGRVVNIGYDNNGRFASVSDAQRTYLSSVSFGSRTMPSQINFGNGTNQALTFNDRLQMTNQTLSRGSEVLQKYDYGFGQIDSNGNLDTTKNNGQIARIESHIGASKQWTQKFKYDSVGRLGEAEERRGDTNALTYKQKFDFDRFGNLYRKAASNPTTGQENPLPFAPIEDTDIDKSKNRLTSASGTTYNNAGEILTDNKFRLMSFSYDANRRVVKATKASTPDALSVYDASGLRVAEKVNDVWRFLIYDIGGKLVAEYGGKQSTDEGGVKYLLSDAQGSNRAVLNNSGFVQSRMDYQAFGEELNAGVGLRTAGQGFVDSGNLRQKYALTERDEATGLDHTWFRKNETRAGRWTSPDPYNGSMSLENPQSFNRYSYVESKPTNYVDPSGLNMVEYYCYDINTYWHRGDYSQGVETTTRCFFRELPTGGGGGEMGGGGGGGGGLSLSPASPAPPPCTTGSCDQDCLQKEVTKCENSARKYFNDNAAWNVIKDVTGFPGSLAGFSALKNMSLRRLLVLVGKKVFWFAAVASAVYALYDTTQQAVAIENECRSHIPDKCGQGCSEYLPKVGRA
jgi:RHS repeat-associated protein